MHQGFADVSDLFLYSDQKGFTFCSKLLQLHVPIFISEPGILDWVGSLSPVCLAGDVPFWSRCQQKFKSTTEKCINSRAAHALDMYLLSDDSLDGITDGENEQEVSRFILRVISSLQSAALLRWPVRLAETHGTSSTPFNWDLKKISSVFTALTWKHVLATTSCVFK